ncbi:MAG: flavodoxin [Chloroflexi bacterium]|jgi:flavodoxin|nr:flavodoxin [Chloroflexota bacterium]
MSNTLVVYYSLTSNTRQIAEAIAAALDADLELIEDTFNRDTSLGRPRSAIEGLLGLRSSITPPKHDLSEYDLVVVGTPVWAARLSSPVRAYLSQQRASLKRVAFFCTQGGFGGKWALQNMAKVSGRRPIARMIIYASQLNKPVTGEKIAKFVSEIGMG